MDFLGQNEPANSDYVHLFAGQIRSVKKVLNNALNALFSSVTETSATLKTGVIQDTHLVSSDDQDALRPVTTDHIRNGAVSTSKLSSGVLAATTEGRAKVADGYFVGAHFSEGAVTGSKLAGNSVDARCLPQYVDWADKTVLLPAGLAHRVWVSNEFSLTQGDNVLLNSVQHGLGAVPRIVRPVLVCQSVTTGVPVPVGAEVEWPHGTGIAGQYAVSDTYHRMPALSVSVTSTAVTCCVRVTNSTQFLVLPNTSRTWTWTPASAWKFKLYLVAFE